MCFSQCELYDTDAHSHDAYSHDVHSDGVDQVGVDQDGVDKTGLLRLHSEIDEQGNGRGITVVGASGDAGGRGCLSSGSFAGTGGSFVAGVSVRAADPNVTAVGGTNLMIAGAMGGSDPSYVGETAFADQRVWAHRSLRGATRRQCLTRPEAVSGHWR